MTLPYNIAFNLDNQVLVRLITEQCEAKGLKCNSDAPIDCTITDKNTPTGSDATVLEIQKGAVRLGDILDRLHYRLSGRDHHIEDDLSTLDLGIFILKPAENLLLHKTSDEPIRLTDKERLVLRVLYEAGEAGLPKANLLKAVWGYADDAETHTLETHIYRLRQKLEPYNQHTMIKAVDGHYSLDIKKPA